MSELPASRGRFCQRFFFTAVVNKFDKKIKLLPDAETGEVLYQTSHSEAILGFYR